MEWNKTKTIFIIAFLILDMFLASQYYEKRSTNQFETIKKYNVQEDMATDHITYDKSLSNNETKKDFKITADKRKFTKSEIESLSNQTPLMDMPSKNKEVTELQMKFDTPIPLPDKGMVAKAKEIVSQNLIDSDKYKFWKVDKNKKQIIFFQTFNGKYIYQQNSDDESNEIGQIELILNDKNEIVSYEQTMLDHLKEVKGYNIIPPLTMLENLYLQKRIKPYTTIKKVTLGYFTPYPGISTQYMVPVWRVDLEIKKEDGSVGNDEEEYLVDAIEGTVLELNQKGS